MPKSDQQCLLETVPRRLSIGIGGHFGSSFDVELQGGVLTYRHSRPVRSFPQAWESTSEEIQPNAQRWQAFRVALDRLNVWCWHTDYPNPGVCDGTGWSAEIIYADKSVRASGSNCFPGRDGSPIAVTDYRKDGTFTKFCSAVSSLVGSRFR